MATRAVHWHEGMFLRPHHFQAAQRHRFEVMTRGEKWDVHYNWGLRAIDADLEALGNYRFVVHSLEARLRDGTLVAVPEDGELSPVDLREAFAAANQVDVYLAVPAWHSGRANVAFQGDADGVRYLVDTQDLDDENTGVNTQPMQFRRLNFKLLQSGQETTGYELLRIARLNKSARADATPDFDARYIPPVLACDAWRPLAVDVVQAVFDRVGKKLETVADQVLARGITFDSQAQGDPLLFGQLRVLNEAYALLDVLAFAQGIHPLTAFAELCRLTGQLAVFGDARRPPELPRYDHDDLGRCFFTVKAHIDTLLDTLVEPAYKERPFTGAGLRMQVSLEPAWLDSSWDMYVGVQSPLSPDECVRLLRGQLDLKIGSSDRVDGIFRSGQAGLRFSPCPTPPRALPAVAGQVYLQVNRDAPGGEWQHVQNSLSLAIRLNENLIAGNIQGQRILMVKTASQTTTLQFTLYVVPR
jgi:type VI secretion system protein ImpJ